MSAPTRGNKIIQKTKNTWQMENVDIYWSYDYLYSFDVIDVNLDNNCIVQGKHSKFLFDWIKVDECITIYSRKK